MAAFRIEPKSVDVVVLIGPPCVLLVCRGGKAPPGDDVAGFHGLMRCRRTGASGVDSRECGHRQLVHGLNLRPPARRDIDLNHSADECIRAMRFSAQPERCAAEAGAGPESRPFAKATRLK